VPVEIRTSLSKDDSLRIATVENLQRQYLMPLEEAAAMTKLIHIDDSVSAPSDGHVYRPRDLYHGCGLPGTLTRKL
jgi:hypothetical protein